MKLTVRCRSGLRIDFEGSLEELERFDGFLAELARLERDRLAPAPHDAIGAAVASPRVIGAQARAAMSAQLAERHGAHHAQALALAARMRGIPAYIVMPDNAPQVKKDAVAGYGGQISFCAPTLEAREATLRRVYEQIGANVVHPYNDERVIAGQGTAAVELLDSVPELDAVIAPVGGGGLLSGTSIATKGLKPGIRVIAAEPEMADDAWRSMKEGRIIPSQNPKTIADGLLTSLGTLTFPIIQQNVEQIVTVSEQGIIEAMKFVWERAKIVIEPSAAVAVGVLWEKKIDLRGLKVGIILSGGNVDLNKLPWQQ